MDLQKPSFGLGLDQNVVDLLLEPGLNILPDEILTRILIFVPDKYLKNCILVCRRWLNTVIATTFWKEKCLRKCYILPQLIAGYGPTPDNDGWRNFYYSKPYSRNLIQNPSGADGMNQEWTILNNPGDGWVVEPKTIGAKDKPDELLAVSDGSTANFATSYGSWFEMEQVIDLEEVGCSLKLIDEMQPEIYVSEWYTERFDCGCYYELQVQLYGENYPSEEKPLQEHCFESGLIPQWSDNNWKQTEHTFKNYGEGVRYVRFMHRGKDSQFWAGHYGSKMAGAEVRLLINKLTNVQ